MAIRMPVTASASTHQYHLDLQQQKENVFVTQLNERTEDDNIRRFPIVKESADKLLQSGINTLQKTSLLRQAVEVEHVDKELAEKREEFRKRMEVCKAREEALKAKQQKIKDRVGKFDRFLKENEAKRNRALRKYQQEVESNKLKLKELNHLNLELANLRKQKEVLLKRLERSKCYERYMTSVIDVLPEDYLETSGDSLIQGIIQRHEGLSATNSGLVDRNHYLLKEIESGQRQVEDLRRERSKQKLVFNSKLVEFQKVQEQLIHKNKLLEQSVTNAKQRKRDMVGELGQILMGIENLASQAHRRHWPTLGSMSPTLKMSMIQEYFLERLAVERMVRKMMADADYNCQSTTISYPGGLMGDVKSGSVPGFPRKHIVLPPIGNHSNSKRKKTPSSTTFLERLTAISESAAE